MNLRPITCAAYSLDPRFCGKVLSEKDWAIAQETILTMAAEDGFDRNLILGDIVRFRTKSGVVYGEDIVWEAAKNTPEIMASPCLWWESFGKRRPLCSTAVALLNMPATAVIVERCNKSMALQKTKIRSWLSSSRAAKVAIIAYNLKAAARTSSTVSSTPQVNAATLPISVSLDRELVSYGGVYSPGSEVETTSREVETTTPLPPKKRKMIKKKR